MTLKSTFALPAVDGVVFRQFRGEPDYAPMTALQNLVNHAHGLEEVLSEEEVAHEFGHPGPKQDPSRDMLIAESQADGHLIGYAAVEHSLRADGERVFAQDVVVHPRWQPRLEGALFDFTEARAREIAVEQPLDAPHFLGTWRPEVDQASIALLLSRGYSAARHFFEMRRDLTTEVPDLPLPDGVEIRPFEPTEANYRAVYVGNREAFMDHWGSRPWTEDDYQRWRFDPMHDTDLWRIGWDVGTGEVAGVAINTIFAADNETYGFKRGWVGNLSVRRPWRGRGLAKALLTRTFAALRDRGMTEAMLGVDAANQTGALQLYESVGFEVYKRNTVYRKKFSALSFEC